MIAIIADDEKFVRRGIIENIPWNSLGIDTIIESGNGLDCLKKAKEFHPDILIADIRMPKLNGIDLGREIAAIYPKCKIIMISAYSEKEYLKSAISLNVIAYVEKPIMLSELEEALQKAVRRIKEAQSIQEENGAYRIYEDLLCKRMPAGAQQQFFQKISREAAYYSVILVSCRDASLKYRVLKEQVEEQFDAEKIYFFVYQDILPHSYVLLARSKSEIEFRKKLQNGMTAVMERLCGDFFISVGTVERTPAKIQASLDGAVSANDLLFHRGYNTVVSAMEAVRMEEYELEPETRRQIIDYFAGGQREELLTALGQVFEEIRKSGRGYREAGLRRAFEKLMEQFLKIERKGIITELHVWERLFACRTIGEVETLFFQVIRVALPEDMVQNVVVKRILLLVANEYGNPELSIPYICERLGVGKSRACGVFKEETGKTINEYITEYRMNKAKQYLYEDLSLEDVARLTGYSDSNYFSKLFKKVTGVTPTSYRRKMWND